MLHTDCHGHWLVLHAGSDGQCLTQLAVRSWFSVTLAVTTFQLFCKIHRNCLEVSRSSKWLLGSFSYACWLAIPYLVIQRKRSSVTANLRASSSHKPRMSSSHRSPLLVFYRVPERYVRGRNFIYRHHKSLHLQRKFQIRSIFFCHRLQQTKILHGILINSLGSMARFHTLG